MKKLFSLLMVALLVGTMASCSGGTSKKGKATTEDSIAAEFGKLLGLNMKQMFNDPNNPEKIDQAELLRGIETVLKLDTTAKGKSFRYGLMIALQQIYPGIEQMEAQGFKFDRKAFLAEFKKNLSSKDSVSMEKLQTMQTNFQGMMMRAMKKKGAENDKAGKKYIQEQVKKGFKTTQSGIAYKIIKPGSGENFNDSATVDVVYVGKHVNGKEFDNSKGNPVPFNLKMTVPGFREIITMMKPGAEIIAIIPGSLAYGEQGNPQGGIGPNETLEFHITTKGIHQEQAGAKPGMPGAPAGKPAAKPAAAKPAPKK